MTVLLVALGAAVGAPLRFVSAHLLDHRWHAGTLLVNAVGSFLLGLTTAIGLSGSALALVGAGFCGGLTTYSAFAVQTHSQGWRAGTAYACLTLVASLALCSLGFLLGMAIDQA